MDDGSIALIVNAGGQSRRMGQPKALLRMPPHGTPLVVHIVQRLAPLVSGGVVIVTNDAKVAEVAQVTADVLVLPDRWAEGGALGGVATGLVACEGWAMVVACDMPLVDLALFAKLIEVANKRSGLDAVIPRVGGQAQPFHGLWHRRALPLLESKLAAGELQVQAALAVLAVAWMDEDVLGIGADALAFSNVNTPQEWRELLERLERQNRPTAQ